MLPPASDGGRDAGFGESALLLGDLDVARCFPLSLEPLEESARCFPLSLVGESGVGLLPLGDLDGERAPDPAFHGGLGSARCFPLSLDLPGVSSSARCFPLSLDEGLGDGLLPLGDLVGVRSPDPAFHGGLFEGEPGFFGVGEPGLDPLEGPDALQSGHR